ncbi:MAG: 4Fe-4S binding protein [Methanopyraceae archaeon]
MSFDEDECIVRGSCVEICPTGALKIASKEGGE